MKMDAADHMREGGVEAFRARVDQDIGKTGNGHGPSVTATIYSDDHGATWHAGEIAGPDTSDMPSPNETVAAHLEAGAGRPPVHSGP